MEKNEYLEFISLNGGDQFFCVKLFTKTALRNEAFVKVHVVKEMLDLDVLNMKPYLFYWKDVEDSDKTTSRIFDRTDDQRITLRDIIEECEEMQEFCKNHGYSSFII